MNDQSKAWYFRMDWFNLESKAQLEKVRYCKFDIPRFVRLVSIGQVLPVTHYSSFTFEHVDLTSCILLFFQMHINYYIITDAHHILHNTYYLLKPLFID